MTGYDPEIHHRRSTRLPGYDYSQPGYYFVTFCVHLHECVLGQVTGESVDLSPAGQSVQHVLDATSAHLWNVAIDASVVMPNHGHIIYQILDWTPEIETSFAEAVRSHDAGVEPSLDAPARSRARKPTLGQVMAIMKYETTQRVNELRGMTGVRFWQRGFYDHVVRNPRELEAIRRYIAHNPLRWELDRDNPRNLAQARPSDGPLPPLPVSERGPASLTVKAKGP